MNKELGGAQFDLLVSLTDRSISKLRHVHNKTLVSAKKHGWIVWNFDIGGYELTDTGRKAVMDSPLPGLEASK